jgi:spermidine/putrescine ABC transporter ATP-binding subunit
LSLLGPSGCGKTTTLHLIAGFLEPTAGQILIEGEEVTEVPAYRRGLGIVFQNYALFPHMSVAKNIAFGLRMRRRPRAEIQRRVREALALVRLSGYEDFRPRQLSGGQQQRVALARALVFQPKVLLLDEPLAALDKKLRDEMRTELVEIQQQVGITTVFVTHDQQEALALSDRIAVMARGRIEQVGEARTIYHRPATRFVADFIGASNILPVRVIGREEQGVAVALDGAGRLLVRAGEAAAGTSLEILVRPERVEVLPAEPPGAANVLKGIVDRVTFLGESAEAWVRVGPHRLRARIDAHRAGREFAAGSTAWVRIDPEAFLIL